MTDDGITWLSLEECAKAIGVGYSTICVYRARAREAHGRDPLYGLSTRQGRRLLFNLDAVARWYRKRELAGEYGKYGRKPGKPSRLSASPDPEPILPDEGPDGEWRNVPQAEGYQIARSDGSIRRRDTGEIVPPTIRKDKKTGKSYVTIRLQAGRIRHWFVVSRIQCTVWNGWNATRYQADHIDGNPLNNAASNLRWLTPADNRERRKKSNGQKNGKSKLSDAAAWVIFFAVHEKLATISQVAELFGTSRANVHKISNGQTWAHVKCARRYDDLKRTPKRHEQHREEVTLCLNGPFLLLPKLPIIRRF